MDTTLSVLITFCRQQQFVRHALDSVFMQKTDFAYEVLVAVDGEDDGTITILDQYKKIYDNLFWYKVQSDERLIPLSRASRNRLFLLNKSKGKYFCVVDGDDFFISEHRFQVALDFLENNPTYIGHACGRKEYLMSNNSFKCIYEKNRDIDFFLGCIRNILPCFTMYI